MFYLWSVNKFARSITKWTKTCDKRMNRLISYIHHTCEYKQYCHVGNTAKQCRLDCFKTPILQEILKIQNPLLEEHCAFWKSHICSNQLDVQETNCCFSQFNRIWNHLFRRKIEIGRCTCAWVVGFDCFCRHDTDHRENGATCWHWKKSRLKGRSTRWTIMIVFFQTYSLRTKKLCCMCLRTMKLWLKWSLKEGVPQWDKFPRFTELRMIGCSIELIWTEKSKSSTLTPKTQLADMMTKVHFTRDEWNHSLNLFNVSHFSSTVCSDTMAKRAQQDSGGERVTAKSRLMMNLIARAPSHVSSKRRWKRRWKAMIRREGRRRHRERTRMPRVWSALRTLIVKPMSLWHQNVCWETRENVTFEVRNAHFPVGCSRLLSTVNHATTRNKHILSECHSEQYGEDASWTCRPILWCRSFHKLRRNWLWGINELHQRSFHYLHDVLDENDDDCHFWYW